MKIDDKHPKDMTAEDLQKIFAEYNPMRRGPNRDTQAESVSTIKNSLIHRALYGKKEEKEAKEIQILEWLTAAVAAAIGITYALLLELWK